MSRPAPIARDRTRLYHASGEARMNEGEPDRGETLANALGVIRRRWPILLGCIALCVAVAVFTHERRAPTYKATSNVAFGVSNLSNTALQVNTSAGDPARDAATNVLIARSREVATNVARELHNGSTADQLLRDVSVQAAPNADVLDITAQTGDPRSAAAVANAFADQYIAFEVRSQNTGITEAERSLREQLTTTDPASDRGTAIRASLQRLAELRAVADGGARIIGRAGAGTRTGAGLKLTVALGLIIGIALGLSAIFLLEAIDRRLTRIEEFEREYRLPALTAVPQSAFRSASASARRDDLEPYRILRSALDISAIDRDVFTVLVTSAVPGEGKTTAAVDLAQAVALTGRSVTLVELDLRRPTLSRHFQLDPRRGVTNVLVGQHALADVLVQPFEELPGMLVLPSGQLPPNPSELLASPELEELLTRLTYQGQGGERMIVIDAPPLLPVSDTQVLLNNGAIDKVLVVARSGKTTREEIRRARAILDRHLLQPLGLIVTGVRDASQYGYAPLDEVAGPRTPEAAPPRRLGDPGIAPARRTGT
jgi:succinoglycan biosynthesis transport protein ExoP